MPFPWGSCAKWRAKRRAKYILLGIVVAAVLFALGMVLFPSTEAQLPRTRPLEEYEVSLVELKGDTLEELELEGDAVMAIFYAPKPIEWYSYSFSMTPALDGNYYDKIYFTALSRQPHETVDEADGLYRYFITSAERMAGNGNLQGFEGNCQLLYQPGDTLPTACEELKQTLAEEDMFSAEMQAALAHQVALNRGEAQPTATP